MRAAGPFPRRSFPLGGTARSAKGAPVTVARLFGVVRRRPSRAAAGRGGIA